MTDGINILSQDLSNTQAAVTDLQKQVMRLWKATRMDVRAIEEEKKENENYLLRLVASNTQVVSEILFTLHNEQKELEGDFTYYRILKQNRRRERNNNNMRDALLESYDKEVTDVCPCGKHKGIRFVDQEGNIVDELCPLSWWVTLSKLAWEERTLSAFLKSTPLDKYLAQYTLK